MEKQNDINHDPLSDFLSGPLRDAVESLIRDILVPVNALAGFFIFLEANTWQVRFLSINSGNADPRSAAHLDAFLGHIRDKDDRQSNDHKRNLADTRLLLDLVFEIIKNSGLTRPEIQGAAIHWLKSKGLMLGNTSNAGSGARKISYWDFGGEELPLLEFQNALDWRATFGGDLERMKEEREDVGYTKINPSVLKVPMSAARPHLEILLAEHIISLDEEAFSNPDLIKEMKSPRLTHYFMPVRGLGQWRAAIVFLEIETEDVNDQRGNSLANKLAGQASELSRLAAEELLTLSLINVFAHSGRQSLAPFTLDQEEQRKKLRNAFSIIWWSSQIEIYKDGECLERLARNPKDNYLEVQSDPLVRSTSQARWKTLSNTKYPGCFSYDEKQHPEVTSIRLLINPIISSVIPNLKDAERTMRDCPFHEVRYVCSHFQANEQKIGRWVDQLADCVAQVIVEQNLRRRAFDSGRAEIYENIAHTIKASIDTAGAPYSRKTLRVDLKELVEEHPKLKMVANTLSLLTIMEGSAGLLRLQGILHSDDVSKLEKLSKDWFNGDSLIGWNNTSGEGTEEVFHCYKNSILHLARSIGSALARPWIEMTAGDRRERHDGYCIFDQQKLDFPPLSQARGGEAIFALLPAVIEPLLNALRYLANQGERAAREPIKLMMEDNRIIKDDRKAKHHGPHILLKIGNRCWNNQTHDPAGVNTTRRLMRLTKLATMEQPEIVDGYRWISILLHPQKLHGVIEQALKKHHPVRIKTDGI